MPSVLRLPSEDVLPPGEQRKFLEELHVHYRDAGRPPVRTIEEVSGQTVSRETARRLLVGRALGRWKVVEALFLALCSISNRNPDEARWEEGYDVPSYREHLRDLWNTAVEAPPPVPWAEQLRAQEEEARQNTIRDGADPWASGNALAWANSATRDEPPF